ncbi:hypothetical protein BXZ70DRAFT_901335 [Cristinia sonorae]|uniref:C2 NT-type domain-containing protein n=1 Tax=Cristinia sonorae TaxID=1940300 RepID=A0A8K0XKU2_9AGAR|nr:hypothetical protein BXZ70DRAFT_901335 [Cristinia sonorae]
MSKPAPLAALPLRTPSASHDFVPSTPGTHGFRNQLGSLLPRHALFQVRVHIDQLSNVPLVTGEFGVRWKFKNVQSSSGLFSKMKSASSSTELSRRSSGANTPEGPHIHVTDDHNESADESDRQDSFDSTSTHADPLRRSSSSSNILAPYITASPPQTPTTPDINLTPLALPPSAAPTITKATFSHLSDSTTEARGATDWARLHNYNVTWDQHLSVVVQMDVHRETGDLLPNELKLVVMQRVIHGDPNSPQNPRMGALYLNLAEYANAGPVTRRYLLRESKTNATLKLTIDLEFLAGTKHYKPPPLPKGEILAEVSGLLTNNGLLSTRLARNLDLYNRGTDYAESDSSSSSSPSTSSHPAMPYATVDGQVDYDRLAVLNGLHTTEHLIEAIFNPVPTTSQAPSPFTYYDPEKAREREDSASSKGGYSASEHSSGSSFVEKHAQGVKAHWWQKLHVGSSVSVSRPGTPGGRTFVRPLTPRFSGEGVNAVKVS